MKRLRFWWPALVWALAMWGFSSESLGATHTSRFIGPFLRWLFPEGDPATIELLHTGIRKAGHLAEYFVLSLLLLRGVRGERSGWRAAWGWTAIALAGAYAAADEIHQAFVPGRGPSPFDVLIDCAGAAAAQGCAWYWTRRQQPKKTLARDGGTG